MRVGRGVIGRASAFALDAGVAFEQHAAGLLVVARDAAGLRRFVERPLAGRRDVRVPQLVGTLRR